MRFKSPGIRVLGLSFVAALAVMAFTAAGAQAAGDFVVNGNVWGGTETFEGEKEEAGTLLVPALNLEINCTNASLSGDILAEGHALGEAEFSGCAVFSISPLNENTTCNVLPIVALALGLMVLQSVGGVTGTYLLLKPDAGLTFTTIELVDKPGKVCNLEEEYAVTGTLLATLGAEAQELLVKAAANQGAAHGLFFGGNAASIDNGAVKAELTGLHAAQPWGGIGL